MSIRPIIHPNIPRYTMQLPDDLRNLETATREETERLKLSFSHPPRRGAHPFPKCWITVWPYQKHTCFMFDAYTEGTRLTLPEIAPYLNVLQALGWDLTPVKEWRIDSNLVTKVHPDVLVFAGQLKRPPRASHA